jgi:hypothetical protein
MIKFGGSHDQFGDPHDQAMAVFVMGAALHDPFCRKLKLRHSAVTGLPGRRVRAGNPDRAQDRSHIPGIPGIPGIHPGGLAICSGLASL